MTTSVADLTPCQHYMCTFAKQLKSNLASYRKSPSIPAKYEFFWHRTIFTLLNTIGYRCFVRPNQHKATTTTSATLTSSSTTARVLMFLKLHWLRLVSKSNAFSGGHCNTIPHSVRIRRFLRSPRQLPQVALHESLVLKQLFSSNFTATASHWRYSILLDRHFLICFDHWKRQLTNADCLKKQSAWQA